MREWGRQRRARNYQKVIAYKLEKGCADCGYNEHHAVLEFDHIDDNKTANVASLIPQEVALWNEIAKCEVVCANCHRIRTHNRRGPLE